MPKIYASDIVWTRHSELRRRERGVPRETVIDVLLHPKSIRPGKRSGTYEFSRRFSQYTVTVVVEEQESRWVIVSLWRDPPLPGTKDARQQAYYKRYKKAGFIGKFWYLFLRQIGWW